MADSKEAFLHKLLATFRAEAEEHLQDIVSNLVLLEQADEEAQKDLAGRILKRLHTFKGAARAINLTALETLCHAMEGVFSAIGESHPALAPGQFDVVHQACDTARLLANEPSGRIRNQAAALASRLDRLSTELKPSAENTHPAAQEAALSDNSAAPRPAASDSDAIDQASGIPGTVKVDVIPVQVKKLDAIRYQAEALLSADLGLRHHISDLLELADGMADERNRARLAEPRLRRRGQKRQAAPGTKRSGAGMPLLPSDRDAKNRAVQLDQYINRVELQCRGLASALSRTHRNFTVIRSRLMDAALETALVPFATALEQLPGLVRNLARSRSKEAVLNIQGETIHVDRRILGPAREALIHLVTNAVDHGIEPAERRLTEGKASVGTILIKVIQRGSNQVSVTVADDGAGIDVAAVVNAAVKRGILQTHQLAGLNDRQKLQLALHAGVSTSSEVTPVSGRGVGLAVAAEKVALAGGELLIENSPGAGCSFELLLPVRLAMLRGLILRTRGFLYVLPLSGIESVRALRDGDIRTIESRETLLVGERVVPVVRLGHLLGLERAAFSRDPDENIAIIARAGSGIFALLVDEILSEQEVLPKSLGKQLRRVRYVVGVTQLGDGSLVPILGLEDIVRHGFAIMGGTAAAKPEAPGSSDVKRMLVVEDSITSRLLLKHILEGAGYQVETAVDGLDALSRLRQGNFSAVVSDVEMPQLDGFALIERIRSNPATEEIPVVLVTSLQSPEERERGLRAGADAYVVKGAFDQDNLLTTLRRLV